MPFVVPNESFRLRPKIGSGSDWIYYREEREGREAEQGGHAPVGNLPFASFAPFAVQIEPLPKNHSTLIHEHTAPKADMHRDGQPENDLKP